MCLISTLLPVPEGPSTIETWSSGRPRLSPLRMRARPNCLTRPMISIASVPPWSRVRPVWKREGSDSEGSTPGVEQARRAEKGDRLHAHHLERVDLVGDPHRAELGDDPGADLGGEHVAEGVGHDLAQVAPGREDAGVSRSALGAQQIGALDPALQA